MDDNGAPQQPTPAPTPPPAASPTPPPPATGSPTGDAQYRPGAPAVGQPAPYGQPASSKKGPTTLILIIVAVVVLLCALAMCGVGAFVLLDSSPDAEESIEQADAYYGSATSKVEELNTYYSEDFASIEGDGGEAQAEAILEEVRGLVAAARDDLAECTGYIAPLEESTFKTQYLDAIALLNQSVDTYEQLYEFMPAENALQAELDAMTAELSAADDHLRTATEVAGDEDYAKMKSEAQAALTAYTEAESYFADLAEEYPGREFDLQATIEVMHQDAATAVLNAAEAGLAGDIDEYNEHVAEYQEANDQIDSATWPEWYDDWSRLWDANDALYDEAYEYYLASVQAWNRSVDAYNAGEY